MVVIGKKFCIRPKSCVIEWERVCGMDSETGEHHRNVDMCRTKILANEDTDDEDEETLDASYYEKRNKANQEKMEVDNLSSGVIYEEIFPNVDIEYVLQSQELKENIILKNADAQNTFVFQFKVNGLELAEEEDGRIVFKDGEENTVFEIQKPFAYDGDGEFTDKVSLELVEGNGKKSELTVTVDQEWLDAEGRQFPVVIDPVVQTDQGANSIIDSYALSGYPDNNYYARPILKTGVDATAGIARSFIRFDLPELKSGDMVVDATLNLCSYTTSNSAVTVGAYQVMDTTWTSQSVTWKTQPIYEEEPEDYTVFTPTAGKWASFNITNMVKYWYEENSNGGVMVRALKEDGQYVEYVSADCDIASMAARPTVLISYVNNNGLEDYWTYHQQDVGRAGTGYVNDYNGNLVFIHQSARTSGSRMPLALTHVYNTNDKNVNLGYGYGWRLNYQQTIKFTQTADGDRYEYVDEDGTYHYFKQDTDGNKWKDESGIDLELTINNSSSDRYVINDKQDNKLIFDTAGKLIKITDNNGNTLTITYNSSNQILIVTDGAGRTAACTYNSSGLLSNVADPFGDMDFTYDSNSMLIRITYEDHLPQDTKYAVYIYNSSRELTSAKDIDGYEIRYEYTPWTYSPHRVYTVAEYVNGTKGQSYQIARRDNRTVFTDHKGRKETYLFNNLGQTVSVQNDEGYGQSSKYITEDENKNKLSKVTKLQSTVVNLLKNPNLESSGNWTAVQNGGTAVRISDSSRAMTGNYALHVTSAGENNSAGFQQAVTLEAGKTYTFSSYVNFPDSQTDTEDDGEKLDKCVTQIKAVTSAGTLYSENCDHYGTESGWYRMVSSITIPEGVTVSSATVYAGVEGAVTAYFDCFQLVKSAAPSRYNLIENGDFSNGTTGFTTSGTNTFDRVLVNNDGDYGKGVTYRRGVVTEPVLNMRFGPGTEYGVVTTAPQGTYVTAIGGLVDSGGVLWYYTYVVKDGLVYSGYMISSFISFSDGIYDGSSTGIVDTANLNIRQGAGTGNTILVTIPRNTQVQVVDAATASNGQYWLMVYVNYANTNYIGYALAEYIYCGYEGVTYDRETIGELDQKVFHMTGNPADEKKLTQTIHISGKANDTYMANVWATGYPVAKKDSREYGLEVEFVSTDGTTETYVSSFEARTLEWQFLNDVFIAKKDYTKINVSLVFHYNCNAVAFDGLALYKEDFAQSYIYDEDGNVTSVTNNARENSKFEYTNNNLTKMTDPVGNEFTYTYDTHHNVTGATSAAGVKYTFAYDDYGNPTQTKIVDGTTGEYIQSTATYSDGYGDDYDRDNNSSYKYSYQDSVTDALGNTTTYKYRASKGVLKESIDPKGQSTIYHHDGTERVIGVSTVVDGQTVRVDYNYKNDSLESIGHNGFLYYFEEDAFGNNTSVAIKEKTTEDTAQTIELISRTYESNNGNLLSETYANGYTYLYSYDEFDRVIEIGLKDSGGTEYVLYRYGYDNEGNLAVEYDIREDIGQETIVTRYYYDLSGRLIHTSTDGEESYRYVYDANDNLTKSVQKNEYRTLETVYGYDEDSREVSVTTPRGYTYTTTYDGLGRVESQEWNKGMSLSNTYTYQNGINGSKSSQVKSVNGTEFTYDANGNITLINALRKNIVYTYDELNQLVREDNSVLNQTIIYDYDLGGNILKKSFYIYQPDTTDEELATLTPSDTVVYGYDTLWKDKMISFDGQTITYDELGNPLSYRGMTLTWEKARELGSVTKDGVTYQYRYNQDGMRNRKYLSDGTVYYQIEGDLIVGEQKIKNGQTQPEYEMEFIYDSSGNVIALLYNGMEYYYVKNLQGDITGIVAGSGEQIVEYTYDSWGRVVDIGTYLEDWFDSVDISQRNPFRYRGYYYDSETGFYYVSSRYYDPEVGRWLNADNQLSSGDMTGMNLFTYCGNNPVNRIDPTGEAWYHWALGAAVVAGCAIATVVTCGGFAAAATAVCMVGNGFAAATTASTIAASAFIGSATVYGMAVLSAVSTSSSVQEFNDQGNWGTVASTAGGTAWGAYRGYSMSSSRSPKVAPNTNQKSGGSHTSGVGSPKNNINPGGSFTKFNNSGNLYSYTQFDNLGRQTMRMDFQGRPHAGVLPHIHLYVYPPRGGKAEYVFDLNWHLIN